MNNDKVVEIITETMKSLKIPGVAVGVLHADERFTAGLGVTNVDHPLTVDETTLSRLDPSPKRLLER